MGTTVLELLIFLGLVGVIAGVSGIDPIVNTNLGLIRGLPATDGEYFKFLGIPYASVDPLNPFGPSSPHAGFETPYDAFNYSAICPQRGSDNLPVGSLDCLSLNVYVPNSASSANLRPVLVWIHGGGFSRGDGATHGPKYLVRHDVIVITLNYRLGPYGFLCLDSPRVPGNQGFKDQLAALRWIKNNIEAFGGDSNKITIGGQSAGGVSVDLHLTFTDEDLFHNVIIQSGTSFAPFIVEEADSTVAFRLAQQLGFETTNLDAALDFMRTLDTDVVIAASVAASVTSRPCVENVFSNVERFITDQPTRTSVPNVRNVSVLIGFTNNERGGSFENINPDLLQFIDPFAMVFNLFDFEVELRQSMSALARQFYIGDERISIDVDVEILDFVADFGYNHPSTRRIESYIANGASTIYHYVFGYDGGRNYGKVINNINTASGAVHEDELGYLFDLAVFEETPSPEDQLTIDRVTTLWTNFVKYSNPTPAVSKLFPVEWPAVTNNIRNYLDIDSEVTAGKRPFHSRMAFWDLFVNESNPF